MIHFDEDAILQYAEGSSPIGAEIESHAAECPECAKAIADQREIVDILKSEDVWAGMPDPTPAALGRIQEVSNLSSRIAEEDRAAAALLDEILQGPSAWWRNRLLKSGPAGRTAGMVRQLMERAPAAEQKAPANAVEMLKMAIEIAENFDICTYPSDLVMSLRGQTMRDYAYALMLVGRMPDALKAIDRAEALFRQCALPEYEVARARLVRATIVRYLDRMPEAIALAHQAAETLRKFGDQRRHANALVIEAAILFESGSIREALELWREADGHPGIEETTRVMVLNNIGLCYTELREYDKAAEAISEAIAACEVLGMETPRVKARWALATAIASAGRTADAVPLFRQTWKELENLEMEAEAGLVGLELAEALLILGRNEEVPQICRTILERFTRVGMTSRAITALSFLREAVAVGQAHPTLVRHVHDFLRHLPQQPPQLSAPLPLHANRFED